MPVKSISISDILGTDPIAYLFFKKLKFKPFGLALFFVITGLLYGFIIPFLLNIPPANDLITIINIVLVFPTAGYFYAYQPTSIHRIYQSVTRFLREESESEIPFDRLRKQHVRPYAWIVGLFIGGASAGFGFLNATQYFDSAMYNWWVIALTLFIRFLAMYMIGLIIARHIVTSIALNKLFQHTQFPLAVDTDRIDVFSAIKRFSLEIIGVAAIIGLNLGLQPLTIQVPMPEYAFYVVLYFVLVPIAFFLPLWVVHRRMVAIKNEMLDKLHNDFEEESDKLYQTLAKDPNKDLSSTYIKQTETLTSIKKAIQLINDSPDWPFQGTIFYRLIITLLSPFFLVIFEIFINIISDLLVKI